MKNGFNFYNFKKIRICSETPTEEFFDKLKNEKKKGYVIFPFIL